MLLFFISLLSFLLLLQFTSDDIAKQVKLYQLKLILLPYQKVAAIIAGLLGLFAVFKMLMFFFSNLYTICLGGMGLTVMCISIISQAKLLAQSSNPFLSLIGSSSLGFSVFLQENILSFFFPTHNKKQASKQTSKSDNKNDSHKVTNNLLKQAKEPIVLALVISALGMVLALIL